MRCGSVIVAIALAACAAHPTGLELAITPGEPGDTVELYFGTTQGADPISISGFAQYSIAGATYYAADQLTPHSVPTKANRAQTLVTIEQPATTPALSFVLALETASDGRQFAAAASVVETTAGALNSYTLVLTPTRPDPAATTAGGPFAAVWRPTTNSTFMPPHPEDECEYFNGRDNLGNPIDVAIVVDTDTFAGTGVVPYSDHDCDGFPQRDTANMMAEECQDTIYDAVTPQVTLQTAVCASNYVDIGATLPSCYASGPACTDGQPPAQCPDAAHPVTDLRSITSYCVPTAFCTDCPTDLGCLKDPNGSPPPYVSCPVSYDPDTSEVCLNYSVSVTLPPAAGLGSGASCTGLSPPFIQIGRPGEGFSSQLDVTDNGRDARISASSTGCSVAVLTITGKWMPSDETILLAISPPTGPGMIVAVDFIASTDACGQAFCSVPEDNDASFDACINQRAPMP